MQPLTLTREQIRRVDRIAAEHFAIPGIVLMENAGRNAAEVIRRELLSDRDPGRVAIVCGGGNNGGDGFAIARHLANAGVEATVYLAADPAKLTGDAETNHRIVERMQIPVTSVRTAEGLAAAQREWRRADVLVDALLGTGFAGQVRAPLSDVIDAINAIRPAFNGQIAAIDVPSGLDTDTGCPTNVTVRADLTITMVAEKAGFRACDADHYTGRVVVVDIGAPPAAIRMACQQDA
jgi:NAD(P)H-hydrate epimerase